MFYPLTLCAMQVVFMIMIMIIILGLISFFVEIAQLYREWKCFLRDQKLTSRFQQNK